MDLLSAFTFMIHELPYEGESVRPILMGARKKIKAQIANRTVRAESPNGSYMTAWGGDAKRISDDSVMNKEEDYDLQQQELQRVITAEHPPNRTLTALHPSETSSELMSTKQEVKGVDSHLTAMTLILKAVQPCSSLVASAHRPSPHPSPSTQGGCHHQPRDDLSRPTQSSIQVEQDHVQHHNIPRKAPG